MIDGALLALTLAGIVWFARPRRQRSHAGWIGRALGGFAGPALLTLASLGGWSTLVALPAAFAPLANVVPRLDPVALLPALATGLPIGLAVVLVRLRIARRRGHPVPRDLVMPTPLAARSRAELLSAAATAIVAGVTEELTFRLTLPLLIARLCGSALAGFAVATLLFASLHRYQSWRGQLLVAGAAVFFAWLFLATGALWLVMLLHAAIDVMALAVRPWLAGFGRPVAPRR